MKPILQPILRQPLLPIGGSLPFGGGVDPKYLGAVATRGVVPNTKHATNTQVMAQSRHFARDNISSIRLLYSNWWTNGTTTITEESPGASLTVTASISTDLVNWSRVTFAGADSGVCPSGDDILSDPLDIEISTGEEFFVRTWKNCSGGVMYSGVYSDVTNDELFRVGTSVPDNTSGGAFTGNANNFFGGPTALLGLTSRNSVLLIGDSITYGTGDQYTPSEYGDLGKLSPSFGAEIGYIMAGRVSDSALDFMASHAKRVALSQYVSHVIGGHGRNDLDKGQSQAQIQSNILSIAALFDKPVWWDTISPMSSSTDGWATVANQTTSPSNTRRGPVNNWIRSTPTGLAGAFDTCIAIENDTATNDGRWKAGPITGDGQHPNAAGYALIKSSGAIDPSVL